MALLNYTTTVDAIKTAAEIEVILIRGGAKAIQKEIDNGKVISIKFIVDSPIGTIPIELPVQIAAVAEILRKQKKNNPRIKTSLDQAERTAWRCLKDWVEAQMALIQIGMASMDQIFLPYVINKGGKTLYDTVREHGYLLERGNDGDDNCDCCPLVWPDDVKCDDMKDGTAAFSLYEEWVIEPDLQFKSKLAAQIRDLPVRDGVECE